MSTVARILAAAGRHYRIEKRELLSRCRFAHVVRARHVAMYLAASATSLPYSALGRLFCRDGSDVLYARRRIAARLSLSDELAAELAAIAQAAGLPEVPR
jgi:chromosomal replication initiation ATPase DnaA